MKKVLASLILLAMTVPAFAHHGGPHRGHGFHHHGVHHHDRYHAPRYHHNYGWVVPAVIGGAVVYTLTRPAPVVVEQPVVVESQSALDLVPGTNCTAWKEIQHSDGTVVRERTCRQ